MKYSQVVFFAAVGLCVVACGKKSTPPTPPFVQDGGAGTGGTGGHAQQDAAPETGGTAGAEAGVDGSSVPDVVNDIVMYTCSPPLYSSDCVACAQNRCAAICQSCQQDAECSAVLTCINANCKICVDGGAMLSNQCMTDCANQIMGESSLNFTGNFGSCLINNCRGYCTISFVGGTDSGC